MSRVLNKRDKAISLVLAFSLMFVTTMEGFAYAAEVKEEKDCEEQSQIIENAISNDLINEDVYQTQESIIADGYSSEIIIPKDGDGLIELNDGDGQSLEFGLPDEAAESDCMITDNGTMIYRCSDDVSMGVQPLSEQIGDSQIDSVRALITISNASAPREYSFDFKLNEGERLVTAKEYLGKENDTGEAYIVDSNNQITSVIDPAWAKDANGDSVDTRYEVRNNSLLQIVDFNEDAVFPVVADPTAWQITKCVGAIVWVIGISVFAVAKIAKISKYIKALGGIKKSASKLIGIIKKARSIAKKNKTSTFAVLRSKKYTKRFWKGAATTLINFGAAVLGIDEVVNNCSF